MRVGRERIPSICRLRDVSHMHREVYPDMGDAAARAAEPRRVETEPVRRSL